MLIIFGGTFDPIHNGHLEIATKLYNTFNQDITLLPIGIPPYKTSPVTTPHQRLDMINLAIQSYPYLKVNTVELDSDEYSYTYKTINIIRRSVQPTTPILFIIGYDSFVTFDNWDNWRDILSFCHLVVVMRHGYVDDMLSRELKTFCQDKHTDDIKMLKNKPHGNIYKINFTPQDVSSTNIRHNIVHDDSYRKYLDGNVYKYIVMNNLYTKSLI